MFVIHIFLKTDDKVLRQDEQARLRVLLFCVLLRTERAPSQDCFSMLFFADFASSSGIEIKSNKLNFFIFQSVKRNGCSATSSEKARF